MPDDPRDDHGFERLSTDAPLGCELHRGKATFRIFAPRATAVTLEVFERFEDEAGTRFEMSRCGGGAWVRVVKAHLAGKWYGYRIDGPGGPGEMFDPSVLVADPYSKAVTTLNHWRLPIFMTAGRSFSEIAPSS